MKIAVYGSSGMVGSRVAAEAVARGHDVVGVTRSGGVSPDGVRAVTGSANDPVAAKELAATVDVVVSAIGPAGGDPRDFVRAIETLITATVGTRLMVVGGAGSLLVNGRLLLDAPGFPEIYRPPALALAEVLDTLRATPPEVDWTLFSPAPEIAPGERTGIFTLGADEPVGTHISAEDFAVALIDELEHPVHRRRRFTIAY
ncbi:NAD(P)H-binding protein [Kribbella sandramycini]|uniref:NAD(P)H-binding protein n=1 Tax=Kribbella sandramycini TaxID=60450 RepID=A0A7Y4KW60_9ACTN|nr:putative NADH-flavin reductase [Kribbella sandramycini]NOL39748.1 NAD(P)H-binding protein [Kribbella sandramycini]